MVSNGENTAPCFRNTFPQIRARRTTQFRSRRRLRCSETCLPIQITSRNTFAGQLGLDLHAGTMLIVRCNRTAAGIVVHIAYGQVLADRGDAYVALADSAMAGLGAAGVFGTFMVDYFPLLKYYPSFLPGGSFQTKAKDWRRLSREMLEMPFKAVKTQMVHPTILLISTNTNSQLYRQMDALCPVWRHWS